MLDVSKLCLVHSADSVEAKLVVWVPELKSSKYVWASSVLTYIAVSTLVGSTCISHGLVATLTCMYTAWIDYLFKGGIDIPPLPPPATINEETVKP